MNAQAQDQSREVGDAYKRLAKGLGWFSIGLGLFQLLASRALSRLIGAPQLRTTLPALGLREIIPGIGILSGYGLRAWLWTRVLGDIMNLSILGGAFSSRKSNRDKLQGATVNDIMKATCWHDQNDVRVEEVPAPKILNPRDAIVRITSTAICGSDLHLYDGFIPTMAKGYILGHEFMGEIVETGPEVKNLRVGDRVVVPFPIACGSCFFCKRQMYSLCDNTNPNAQLAEKCWGHAPCGIFGYSHMLGGVCRRPGSIRAGSVCRRRADQDRKWPLG